MASLSFNIAVETFDVNLLPPPARTLGTDDFRQAVAEFLQREFQGFGGHATFVVDDRRIAVTWNPDSTNPNPLEAIVSKLQRGQRAEGIQLLELLLSHRPDDVNVLYNLGMALSDAGRLGKAETSLRRAVELAPDFAYAIVALGVALSRQGKNTEAIEVLKSAVVIEPGNPWAQLNLGVTYLKEGNHADAQSHLRKATELNPHDQHAWLALGDACRLLEESGEAKTSYRKTIDLNPHNDLAEMARQGSSKLAQTTFQKKLGGVPNSDAVTYCLNALKKFSTLPKEEVQKIAFEIAILGRKGFDVNNPEANYRLKNWDGSFTALQLVSFMYVALHQIAPGEDTGFDLSRELQMAQSMFASGR